MIIQNNRYSLFFLLFVLTAVYSFVFSESGILERRRLDDDKDELNKRIEKLKEENVVLNDLHERYKDGEFNKEEALKAGYVKPGEKVLFFKGREFYHQDSGKKILNKLTADVVSVGKVDKAPQALGKSIIAVFGPK